MSRFEMPTLEPASHLETDALERAGAEVSKKDFAVPAINAAETETPALFRDVPEPAESRTMPDQDSFPEVEAAVRRAWERQDYRPIAVAVIRNEHGKVLVVRPEKDKGLGWSLPGGGIDRGEGSVDGLRRELAEELGIDPGETEIIRCLGTVPLKGDADRSKGFKKGKLLVFYSVAYFGTNELAANADELAGYRWLSASDAEKGIETAREKKTELYGRMVRKTRPRRDRRKRL